MLHWAMAVREVERSATIVTKKIAKKVKKIDNLAALSEKSSET